MVKVTRIIDSNTLESIYEYVVIWELSVYMNVEETEVNIVCWSH
jgi:hypothetical protein